MLPVDLILESLYLGALSTCRFLCIVFGFKASELPLGVKSASMTSSGPNPAPCLRPALPIAGPRALAHLSRPRQSGGELLQITG